MLSEPCVVLSVTADVLSAHSVLATGGRDPGKVCTMSEDVRLWAEIVATDDGARLVRPDGRAFKLSKAHYHLLSTLIQTTDGPGLCLESDTTSKLGQLMTWLNENCLVIGHRSARLRGWRVRLYGLGAVGIRIARGLLRLGVTELTVVDLAPHRDPLADPIRTILGPGPCPWPDATRLRLASHWFFDDRPDLAIVAGPGVEPDRAILALLSSAAVPTLMVSAHLGAARVGPLNLLGVQGCWRCRDLWLAEADPLWPEVVAVLATRLAAPKGSVAAWAADLALLEMSAFHDHGTCELIGQTICWDDVVPGLHMVDYIPHPACPCRR